MLLHTSRGSVDHSLQQKAHIPCETHLLMLWHLSEGYQGALAFARGLHLGRAERMLINFTVRGICLSDLRPSKYGLNVHRSRTMSNENGASSAPSRMAAGSSSIWHGLPRAQTCSACELASLRRWKVF